MNDVKICQFREKESQIKPYWFCSGNISKDFAADNMEIAKLNGKGLRAFCYDIVNIDNIWWKKT